MQFHARPTIATIALLAITSAGSATPGTALASANDGLTPVAHAGSGHILRGSLGMQPSVKAASIALLARVHSALGSRPTVVKIIQNSAQHTVAIVFTGTQGGAPVTGLSIATAAPGVAAAGSVVYDTTANFSTSAAALLHDLGAAAPASGGSTSKAIAMAPAEPLVAHPFPDNTGSISLPADWTLKAVGGGSAYAQGPSGERVAYQQPVLFADPAGMWAKMLMNGTNIYADPVRRAEDLKTIVMLPYTGDPERAWKKAFTKFNVDSYKKLGDHNGFISGHANLVGGGWNELGQVTFFAYVNVMSKDNLGKYVVVANYCIVPKKAVAAHGATAAAVFNSVRINEAQINANLRQFDAFMQQQFDSSIARDREQDAVRESQTQDSIANANASSDARQAQGAAMVNFASDRTLVADPETGAHEAISNSALPPNYQAVPLQGYIKGVDY